MIITVKMLRNSLYFIFLLLGALTVTSCTAPHPAIAAPPTPPPPLMLKSQPRVALALGGGGARSMAHVGVLKILQQEQIPIDLIVGCSAGSIVGALYADHRNVHQVQQILQQTNASDLLDFSPSLQGAVTGNALQDFLIHNMHARYFNQLHIPFIAVATNLKTGNTVALSSGPLAPAINASAALPPVFDPVKIYGKTLVDGGVTDLVPVNIAKRYRPKIIIAVNISPLPRQHISHHVIDVYNRAYILSDNRFAAYNMEGADIKLHPNVGQIGNFDSSNKAALIAAGENAARHALPQLCALLKANNIRSRCS